MNIDLIKYFLNENVNSHPSHTFSYENDGNELTWDVSDLWNAVRNIKPIALDINIFRDFVKDRCKDYNDDDWIMVDKANTDYPIIVSKEYRNLNLFHKNKKVNIPLVFDGMHRLTKLLRKNESYVNCQQIEYLPDPIKVIGKPFTIPGIRYYYNGKLY